MARNNSLVNTIGENPQASILFTGPEGYISPTWVRKRDWAPTWNYARLNIKTEIQFDDLSIDEAIRRLVEAREGVSKNAWRVAELGERYEALAKKVIPFRAYILELNGRFKLGQDENPNVLADILGHLPDAALARWMRRFNKGRC